MLSKWYIKFLPVSDIQKGVDQLRFPPVAADEVVEDAPDKNPDEMENRSGEQRGKDLLRDKGALVRLEAQDDDGPDVGAGKNCKS